MNLKKRPVPVQIQNQKTNGIIITAGVLSLIAYFLLQIFSSKSSQFYSKTMIKAAQTMQNAISVIGEHCEKSGIKIDEISDPNNTGLIGVEFSEITTTVGHLQAKRTTTNPNFAALIVQLLEETGVNSGDTVAIGCSASFPALMIASLATVRAMKLHPVIIISLGASSYGANNPGFNLLDIYQLLIKEKIFNVQPAAISLGGEKDIGEGYEMKVKKQLIQQIQKSEIPFIYETNLQKSVKKRMEIYQAYSTNHRISAFINCGGSQSNMGTSGLVLKVKPGLNQEIVELPPVDERGVIFEMAALGIPVIHLLYIKGLVLKYGLPWDPIPLPEPGESEIYFSHSKNNFIFWLVLVLYFLGLFLLIIFGWKSIYSHKMKKS